MPRKLAALMKSPASASPFWKPVTFEPAAKNSLVVFVRRAAHPVIPSVAAMKTKKNTIAVVFGFPSDVAISCAPFAFGIRRELRRTGARRRASSASYRRFAQST